MFNLPWYAWLNILSLPILFVFIRIDYKFRDMPKLMRQLVSFQFLACAGTLLLYRNTHVFDPGAPLTYLLLLSVGSLFAMQVYDFGCGLIMGVLAKFRKRRRNTRAPVVINAATDLDSEFVDIDEAECETVKKVNHNLPNVLSGKRKPEDRLKSFMVMIGEMDEGDSIYDMKGYLSSTLVYAFFVFLIIGPAFIQSIKLVQLL